MRYAADFVEQTKDRRMSWSQRNLMRRLNNRTLHCRSKASEKKWILTQKKRWSQVNVQQKRELLKLNTTQNLDITNNNSDLVINKIKDKEFICFFVS